ncbi:MAG: hypothetical protein AB7O81_24350 [Blastocatellales bacterium]
MSNVVTPQKTDQGWIIEIPDEIATAMGAPNGSLGLLFVRDGKIEVEILPPPSPGLDESVSRIHAKFKDAFEEMKRLGD